LGLTTKAREAELLLSEADPRRRTVDREASAGRRFCDPDAEL